MDMNAGIHKHVIRTNLPARFGSFRKVEKMKVTRKVQMKVDDMMLEVRVGDQIKVKLPGMKMTATCHKVSTEGALFVFDECISRHPMIGLHEWLNEDFAQMIPDKLKRRMRPFGDGSMIRLLTFGEVFGSENCPDWIKNDNQKQLELMKDRKNRIAFFDGQNWCWWWLQNVTLNDDGSEDASTFAYVYGDGTAADTSASYSYGVRPAFLIA